MIIRACALCSVVLLAACSKPAEPSPTEPAADEGVAAQDGPAADEGPGGDGASPERPGLSAADCESQGGTVVGDIGDGAVHQPDYLCPSGQPPVGTIVADPGGPIGVEGSVCCPT